MRNDFPGFCGIRAATKKATTAIDHQGKYKHAATLNKAINTIETMNFIKEFENVKIKKGLDFISALANWLIS